MARILIVDDSPTIRQQMRMCVEGAGHQVDDASDGASALRRAKSNRYDLVITDVSMPGMDGLDLVGRLRQTPAYEATPIFVVTTHTSAEERARGRVAGATAWIVKPFKPAALLGAVARVLARAA